ncbi:MAG: Leucyl-tRNA synthetase [uncultured Thermomicrobiales bacterium]|uniref:Leucine--tRNA ligase n=1 Tax=uncultured Thermomicrobiales bacterium TaxID=1645740 RepID=A0A6J4V5V0_9BACT|nr:MAG: Leucyl-tRNA synthetase [uncultured Thermomicrobiales bacterium]
MTDTTAPTGVTAAANPAVSPEIRAEPAPNGHAYRYDPAAVEAKWRERWAADDLYRVADDAPGPKWYSLTMYPYPSGTLHVGHWYAFAIPDTYARLQAMRGYTVLFPMGFDAFGLPAENAAIRHNIHPATWTFDNIRAMKDQYRQMGAMIDWSREFATCAPEYYRWNQWFFLRMLERGLAYRAKGAVWWCPVDQTVLANEQVLEGNICERCGSVVAKRDLEQWYFKITDYAEELLHDAEGLDWPERVKTMQRNWIGRSEGARLRFALETGDALEVFTTRPDTVWGATFMVLAPEHPLVETITTPEQRGAVAAYVEQARRQTDIERQSTDEARPKTGVFTGGYAVNPVTDERIPVWIADYVLMGYGTGAIMAVPSGDQRDIAFARAFGLPIRVVVQPEGEPDLDPETMTEAYTGDGVLVNSGPMTGKRVPEAVPEIVAWLAATGRGEAEVTYRLRDWLISRQRYWGTPIPVVYCDGCGMVPLPDDRLPVELPLDSRFTPTGQSPLVNDARFLHTECPTCGGPARRETDTMDTFVDSSWYWFRYTSPHFEDGPFDPAAVARWCPVDLYCGGIEHAILHLLYARFFTKVCRDLGLIDHGEPYLRLRNQGMILAEEGTKMSKSRGTQVAPDELVRRHGADALRLHLMYLGPWEQGGPWNSRGLQGMERFLKRAWTVVTETAAGSNPTVGDASEAEAAALRRLTHKTIARVTEDLDEFRFNTMVAALIEFVNELMRLKDGPVARTAAWREAVETLVLLMAPSTPYLAEELWERLGKPYSVHKQAWPSFDAALVVEDLVEVVVQVNGKVRDRLALPADLPEAEARARVLALPRVAELVPGEPRKVVYVPGRLVNVVG